MHGKSNIKYLKVQMYNSEATTFQQPDICIDDDIIRMILLNNEHW